MDPTGLEPLLSELSARISRHLGLHFPRERWADLARGMAEYARASGARDVESAMRQLSASELSRPQIELLAGHLTVGETYFFREKAGYEALEGHILPELLQRHAVADRRLRIWSAGCCTGEEPYSIAMLLDRLMPRREGWNITLLATDVNPAFLRKAKQGSYGEWSFRDTPASLRESCFRKKEDGRFEIRAHLRRMVTFSYLNLAEDIYPSLLTGTNAMDVIFCRNVLMYFAPERAGRVIENLHRSLVDGGWLIVGPAETSSTLFPQFTTVELPGIFVYRKPVGAHAAPIPTRHAEPVPELLPEALRSPAPPLYPRPPVREVAHARPPSENREEERVTPSFNARDCANQGRLAEAIEWCQLAIAADKLEPAHQYLLAAIQQELGQGELAAQSLTRALYLDPDFVLAHFALGNLRLSQRRRREAERHFDNALALLRALPQDEILPQSEGLTAARLGEIIASVRSSLPRAAAAGT